MDMVSLVLASESCIGKGESVESLETHQVLTNVPELLKTFRSMFIEFKEVKLPIITPKIFQKFLIFFKKWPLYPWLNFVFTWRLFAKAIFSRWTQASLGVHGNKNYGKLPKDRYILRNIRGIPIVPEEVQVLKILAKTPKFFKNWGPKSFCRAKFWHL